MADDSEILLHLGAQVRHHRTAKGLTQEQLAEAVGLTRASITNIERGQQNVGYAMLVAIASALGVTVARLTETTVAPRKPATFDADALHRRIDTARSSRGLMWADIATSAQLSRSTLTRLAQGHVPNADGLARLLLWLGDTDIQPYIEE